MPNTPSGQATRPSFAALFTPKLVTILREGYGFSDLRQDAVAGLTVAIVALPLSMAIAIAAGTTPERGLITAIVGGFLISLLGGSRFQIGGPAAAFIGLIALTIERHGYDGLVLATMIAGLILMTIGFLQLGTYIKYIPFPVTVGFTAGIAVIILASQMRDMLGLTLAHEPSEFIPKIAALWNVRGSADAATIGITILSIFIILLVRYFRPAWPALLFCVVIAALVTYLLKLDVATIGTRFGAIPQGIPAPHVTAFSFEKLQAVLPDAFALAFLGAIESLLSAVIADGMTGRRHRSNCELVAQGVGNFASALFGGICVTGTIARTATNIRAGAKGPIAGMLHSIYLLFFVLLAAPLASFIPLASLGAVLAIVAWNMIEKEEFWILLRSSWADGVVLLTTFLLTVFVDLVTAIGVGVVLGSFLLLHRIAQSVQVDTAGSMALQDQADSDDTRGAYDPKVASDRDIMVYRIRGVFFFGATMEVSAVLDRIGKHPRVLILDFSDVPLIDSTAAKALAVFARKLERSRTEIDFAGLRPELHDTLNAAGIQKMQVYFSRDVETALNRAHGRLGASPKE